MKRWRMLSIRDTLDPTAREPAIDGRVEGPSAACENSVEEVTQEEGEQALREKRQKSEGREKGILKPCAVRKMRLGERRPKEAATG